MATQFNYTPPAAAAKPTLPGATVQPQAPAAPKGVTPFAYKPNAPLPPPVTNEAPAAPTTPPLFTKGSGIGVGPGVGGIDLRGPVLAALKNTAETYKNAIPDFVKEAGRNDETSSKNPVVRTAENALAATGSGLNTIFAPITGAVKALSDSISNDPTVQHITQNPVLGKILDVFGHGSDKLNEWAAQHPEAARNLGGLLNVGLAAAGGETKVPDANLGTTADVAKGVVDAAKSVKEIPGAVKEALPHPIEAVREKLSGDNINPQLKASATRIEKPVDTYNQYIEQAKQAKADVKAEPPLAKVGEEIGNNFEKVVKQRQTVGKQMGSALEKVGSIKTDTSNALSDFQNKIKEQGVAVNDKGELSTVGQTKMTGEDTKILQTYHTELAKLGNNPSIKELDAFMSRIPKELDVYKSQNNIIGTTNAERIIKGSLADLRENLNPKTAKNPALKPYYTARQKYADLSNFIEDNQGFLGKKTAAGDFAKDASLAKSSVQSILNNGKKDFLVQLEKLTGYKALDKSIIALQAMKDAGDFRGTSLLQTLTQDVPHSASGVIKQFVDYVGGKFKDKFVGSPEEQTRRFLQTLEGDLRDTNMKQNSQKSANIPAAQGDQMNSNTNTKKVIKLKVSQAEKKVNLPQAPKKGIIQTIKDTPNKQGGFIKVPNLFESAKTKLPNVSSAEKGTMRDFMDYVAGEYKPHSAAAEKDLLAAAQDIAKKYGFKTAFSGNKSLSSAFGKFLNSVKFNK